VCQDDAWREVAEKLRRKHDGIIIIYEKVPRECLEQLRNITPRYVAIVERPEFLNRDYVIDVHKMSRAVDDDMFADFLWGIVTGYDAEAAMRMVDDSTEPLVVKNAVATIAELKSAKWFDRFAWMDDHVMEIWGEKYGKGERVKCGKVIAADCLKKFSDLYAAYDPDLVVTAWHATENNLQLRFSTGELRAKAGKLYCHDRETGNVWNIPTSEKRKVYLAVGNCLIGNVNNTRESMAIAWMSGEHAASMIGYVVPTWHGRNGWGALKYWLTNPGRYTLAEAVYMNQQDFLCQLYRWFPSLIGEDYPKYDDIGYWKAQKIMQEKLGTEELTNDHIGFWYDRDVLAYYGDPKWNVRLQEIPSENDYTVTCRMRGKRCVITITTNEDFSLERMKGDHFKQEHVLDLPFNYFFPKRLKHPRLVEGQKWDAVVDENFLLIYNPNFKPNMTYEVILDVDK